jgi:hypothetical protein
MCHQRLSGHVRKGPYVRVNAAVNVVVRDSRARLRVAEPLNGN